VQPTDARWGVPQMHVAAVLQAVCAHRTMCPTGPQASDPDLVATPQGSAIGSIPGWMQQILQALVNRCHPSEQVSRGRHIQPVCLHTARFEHSHLLLHAPSNAIHATKLSALVNGSTLSRPSSWITTMPSHPTPTRECLAAVQPCRQAQDAQQLRKPRTAQRTCISAGCWQGSAVRSYCCLWKPTVHQALQDTVGS